MKMTFVALMLAIFGMTGLASPSSRAAMQTVPQVDVARYLGTWYQQARNQLPFEPTDCVCAQQKLGLATDGNVSVYNSCNVGATDGKLYEIRGEASPEDSTNSKLLIDFNLPQKGQYWIIAVDAEYRYAVVSDPSGLSLYILSKTPQLAPELYQQAVAEAAKQVDVSKLKLTSQMNCTYP
jgi:apolipoprotein D and lipocalin family protein